MADELYAAADDLRTFLAIDDTLDDDLLLLAVTAASRWIDEECMRRFWLDDTTSARLYFPRAGDLDVDDFDPNVAITVSVATDATGTFGSALTDGTDYLRLPLNDLTRAQNRLRRYNTGWPCISDGRPTVRVTAKWGWPAVPDAVKQACLVAASDLFKMKDAPFGVAAFGDLGAMRVRTNATVDALLLPYKLGPLVG